MKKKALLAVLLFVSLSLSAADDYLYEFTSAGVPASRIAKSSGNVEKYTNIHSKKFTDRMLVNIHKKHYADMDYKMFIAKVKEKYGGLEFKYEDNFIWLDFNEFNRINKLKEFDTEF